MPIINNRTNLTSIIDAASVASITSSINTGTIDIGTGYSYNTFPNSHNPVMVISDQENKNATVSVKGKLDLNGVDVGSALTDIMETLMIVKRDLKMEERYPKLKEAHDHYQKILEDYRLIDMMKGE